MPFLRNFLCCLPLRNGCMWMAKGTIIVLVFLMVKNGYESSEITLPFWKKESTAKRDSASTWIVECSGIVASLLQHSGAKYVSSKELSESWVEFYL
jgi:hypothetical protein